MEQSIPERFENIVRRCSDRLAVKIHDNFVDLGGHPLAGAAIITRIRERRGVAVIVRSDRLFGPYPSGLL
jgi:hypothetical protein